MVIRGPLGMACFGGGHSILKSCSKELGLWMRPSESLLMWFHRTQSEGEKLASRVYPSLCCTMGFV